MKLILGIGNPGKDYINSRHDAGIMLVDFLSKKNLPSGIILKKSEVFMNSSGEAAKSVAAYHKLPYSSLYIAHDDLDLALGNFKIQFGQGPHDHNGINSVEKELKTKDFWRIRIGIDQRDPNNRASGDEYVMQKFSANERDILYKVFEKINNDLKKII